MWIRERLRVDLQRSQGRRIIALGFTSPPYNTFSSSANTMRPGRACSSLSKSSLRNCKPFVTTDVSTGAAVTEQLRTPGFQEMVVRASMLDQDNRRHEPRPALQVDPIDQGGGDVFPDQFPRLVAHPRRLSPARRLQGHILQYKTKGIAMHVYTKGGLTGVTSCTLRQ